MDCALGSIRCAIVSVVERNPALFGLVIGDLDTQTAPGVKRVRMIDCNRQFDFV